MVFRGDRCYLIVGGLKGLCGSLAVYLAKSGAKHLAVISRSGHSDDKSQAIIEEVKALGSDIDLLTGDIAVFDDVEKAFVQTKLPIAGVIQGAMVLRDRTFLSMTVDECHGALACKIRGIWNLHNAAEKLGLELDFFTMLSSISGVVGQKGQGNYAVGNAFLDSFANHRRQNGQPAVSVDLGVIEDVGYIHEKDGMQQKLDTSIWTGINERLLRKIVYLSVFQQQIPEGCLSAASSTQMITSIPVTQPEQSQLRSDARFTALFTRSASGVSVADAKDGSGSRDVQALLILLRSGGADQSTRVVATAKVVNQCFVRILRLSEPMDEGRPLSVYRIDSLAAVEVRNWIRAELGALVTTLDIMDAASLLALCEKIVVKVTAAADT
ncbi:polyketide synthase [Colletotrichum tofieldiae]|uniref:Polyketide synthase n=1 Tax=Colletotrichum tofieldiae TaxID=708197 RepID=A0A166V3W4_9PEZI|nr:polyketide synthase [Colletotrichum tofieldiae]GKT66214.1 polyketide synthase [Colletotrichum tofieldiae]GKT70618.1 polyketide synthase [Colletotrichum tofieldiae]